MPFLKKRSNEPPRSKKIEMATYRQGLRHAIFNSANDKYIGDWKDDVKCGKGIIWTAHGKLYEGDMERNYRHGFGVLAGKLPLPINNVYSLEYRGDWKNGLMDGDGLRVYPDGSFYKGQFRRGKRHGFGQIWYADDSFYSGDWFKDVRQGLGMFVCSNGNRYEGKWFDDLKHGEGLYFHLDSGQMQEGIWKENYCVFSTMKDIPFRQTSTDPTRFAIQNAELRDDDVLIRDMTNLMQSPTYTALQACVKNNSITDMSLTTWYMLESDSNVI
ncbi:unnamed protein product [Brassicogethes aeneus]|uniref:MORN repeat-containing protein 3 n=1 Tax=Brassicogethes aeneus TaxID=1431903 RepID=A0A9P0B6S6_BRAAE|nr:unnamed protein product [Brassicogethes aeneus]